MSLMLAAYVYLEFSHDSGKDDASLLEQLLCGCTVDRKSYG